MMKQCRLCGNPLEHRFLSLGNAPLANSNLTDNDLQKAEPFYPLEVYVCGHCYLVQLEEFETAKNIFSGDYAYFSSYSESWLRHCKSYTDMIINGFGFDKDSFVLEIASNDGYLLQYFKERGIPILGIEPASNIAAAAMQKGIPTDITFFDSAYAVKMSKSNRQPDLIIGNNVLAHNPDLNDFVGGLSIALRSGGIITMEFPHLLRLMEENQFDTIYHEHFSYFSLYSVQRLFAGHGLEIFDVDELPTHGGSLRIYVRHVHDRSKAVSVRVGRLIDKEKKAGLLDLKTYFDFGEGIESTKRRLLRFLIGIKDKGKRIVGYGAPAKGNTLLNYCGIRSDFLNYTVDRSPHKQNKYLPGTHIPIRHPDVIKEDKPDYVMVLPWNIKDEVMEQMAYIRDWGGQFVIPIPKVRVYG
jgi:SAM-dependent methyltransferase